jgi:ATP-dependent DNA ligase
VCARPEGVAGRVDIASVAVSLPVLEPMLAASGATPGGDRWSWEVKWDGWRALVYVDDGIQVRSRTGRNVTASLPELAGLADALDGHQAILDGELVVCADDAVDFYASLAACPPAALAPQPWPPSGCPSRSWRSI